MSKRIFMLAVAGFVAVTLSLPNRALFAQKKQGQARIDSLLAELPKMKEDTNGVKLLYALAATYSVINTDEGLKYALRQQALARKIGSRQGEAKAYNAIGNMQADKGRYPEALNAYIAALHMSEALGDKVYVGVLNGNISKIFTAQGDYRKAEDYQLTALRIAEEIGDKRRIRAALTSLARLKGRQGQYRDALDIGKKALRMAEEQGDKSDIVFTSRDIATSLAYLKEYNTSLAYHFQTLHMAQELGMESQVAGSFFSIGVTYADLAVDTSLALKADSLVLPTRSANLAKGIEYLSKSIAAYRAVGMREPLPIAIGKLSANLELQGDYKSALERYKESVGISDSMFSKENDARLIRTEENYKFARKADSIRLEGEKRALRLQQEAQLAVLHRDYERRQALAKTEKERQQLQYEEAAKSQQIATTFRQKEAEADAAHQRAAALAKTGEERAAALTSLAIRRQRNLLYASLGGGLLMLLIGGFALRAYRQRRASNIVIAAERERSESLLRNILPADVAQELKQTGHTIARQYDEVSVLFTDFVNFTAVGEQLSPQALVKELHECFSAFDAIIRRNGLEKIKTIGDAYMAVCGLPQADPRHAQRTVQAALEIRDFIAERKKRERVFEIRIGINSGSVVAGIVGVKKFAYDIWGDAVNTAARMEQHSEPGAVNISQATYELVRGEYRCDYRGQIAAKNKGEVAMYFVEAAVPEMAI